MTSWRRVFGAVLGLFLAGAACSIGGSIATPTQSNAPVPPSVLPSIAAVPPTESPTALQSVDIPTDVPSVTATSPLAPTATFLPLPVVNPTGAPPASQCIVMLAESTNWVKIRNGPGFTFEAIAILQTYSPVIGSSSTWYEIPLFGGAGTGWVSSTVTKLVGPCQAIQTVVFTPNPGR